MNIRWKPFYTIITIAVLFKLTLHLIADFHSGFQGDELMHIETGHHLAFGFMEFPPFIAILAYLQNLFGSTAVFYHHLFPHIATALIIVLVGMITRELGGNNRAMIIALICVVAGPAFTRTQQLFQPVVFSQLFWLAGFYFVLRIANTQDMKYHLLLTLTLGLGFLTKYDIAFFIIGLSGLFFWRETRQIIFRKTTLHYVSLFLLIISPNIIWQITHQFPIIQHLNELYKSQLDNQSPFRVLIDLFVQLNPFAFIIYILGFIYTLFMKKDRKQWAIASSVLISILAIALAKGKAYYFFPALICLMIMGSIYLEKTLFERKNWAIYPVALLLLSTGLAMLPYGMPVLTLNKFITYARIQKTDQRTPVPFQEFYSQYQWPKVLSSVEHVYKQLPEEDKKDGLIWGKHYKQAGLVDLFHSEYGIPKAISYHGSFYLWAPDKGPLPKFVIAISNKNVPKEYWTALFASVELKDHIENKYAADEEDQYVNIYLCKEAKVDFHDLKEIFKNRVFE